MKTTAVINRLQFQTTTGRAIVTLEVHLRSLTPIATLKVPNIKVAHKPNRILTISRKEVIHIKTMVHRTMMKMMGTANKSSNNTERNLIHQVQWVVKEKTLMLRKRNQWTLIKKRKNRRSYFPCMRMLVERIRTLKEM